MVRGVRALGPRLPDSDHDQVVHDDYDQIVTLSNVSWEDYERIDALRGESSCAASSPLHFPPPTKGRTKGREAKVATVVEDDEDGD